MTHTKDTREAIARQMRVHKSAVYNLSTHSARREAKLILADYVLENFDAILTALEPAGGDVRELVEALEAAEAFLYDRFHSELGPAWHDGEAQQLALKIMAAKDTPALTATPAQPTVEDKP